MKRLIKKGAKTFLILFVGFLLFLTGQTAAEWVKVQQEIKTFTSRGVLREDISTETIKYYQVSRETYYPDEFERSPFYNNDLRYPGAEGDILVTRQSPFANKPGIYDFVTFYFGGHAAYVGEENILFETSGILSPGDSIFKTIFQGSDSTVASMASNYWLNPNFRNVNDPTYNAFGSYYRKEFIGLRVKEVTSEEITEVNEFMNHVVDIEAQYNFFFVFNTQNRYYCTDLISRGFGTITNSNGNQKYNLNSDLVATTVNDLILSDDTYISFYVRTDKNNVKHIYFIE
ncbi:MAG: hypothetical protein PHD47_00985 [Acholeplasmataceae bacterium]|nr:hypothetical protein [Acholeplasmataceae bacterium]